MFKLKLKNIPRIKFRSNFKNYTKIRDVWKKSFYDQNDKFSKNVYIEKGEYNCFIGLKKGNPGHLTFKYSKDLQSQVFSLYPDMNKLKKLKIKDKKFINPDNKSSFVTPAHHPITAVPRNDFNTMTEVFSFKIFVQVPTVITLPNYLIGKQSKTGRSSMNLTDSKSENKNCITQTLDVYARMQNYAEHERNELFNKFKNCGVESAYKKIVSIQKSKDQI